MSENKTRPNDSVGRAGKYLKYAIGEVLLVGIGILIALQVNNWNENRKLRNTETGLLKELKADLTATLDDLRSDIELTNRTLTFTDSLYKKMRIHLMNKSTEPFPVKINDLLNPILYPKLGAYEALQSYGIHNISNDSLRRDITDLYQLQLTRVAEVERRIIEFDAKELKPYIRGVSMIIRDCDNCNSIDELWGVQTLIQQPLDKILQLYMSRHWLFRWVLVLYDLAALSIENLIKDIDSELDLK
ncbi:MAG: hypothetical protein HKN53_10890 [Maribacter sp.]|nr:hypothetical protein [Maribacter sp.]